VVTHLVEWFFAIGEKRFAINPELSLESKNYRSKTKECDARLAARRSWIGISSSIIAIMRAFWYSNLRTQIVKN
jgi:hypothetical protein